MLVPGPAPAIASAPAPGSVPAATGTFLLPGEHTVTECVAHVGLSQGRVSAHLACLAGCGYVQARRAGRNAFYRVADPRVADLIVLARSMAADNAAALAACVYIAPPSPGQGTAAGS